MPDETSSQNEAERLRSFWNARYADFSLRESGIATLTPPYSRLLYRCKRRAYERALRLAAVRPGTSPRIVDGGCGQGFFAAAVQDLFPQAPYRGIDISAKAIAFLQRRFPHFEWICADLADAAALQPTPTYDVAQSIEVLHLILEDRNHRQAIANLTAFLRVGGHLIVTDTLPSTRHSPNSYITFRPAAYYEKTLPSLGLRLIAAFPMYYCVPDMGFGPRRIRRFSRLLPPRIVYLLDRLALHVRLPQLGQSHDSHMKMLVCRKESAFPA